MKKIATADPRNRTMKELVLEPEAWKTLVILSERAWRAVESPAVTVAVILAVLSALGLAIVVEAAAVALFAFVAAVVLAAVCSFVVGVAFLAVSPEGNFILLFLLPLLMLLRTRGKSSSTEREPGLSQPIQELS